MHLATNNFREKKLILPSAEFLLLVTVAKNITYPYFAPTFSFFEILARRMLEDIDRQNFPLRANFFIFRNFGAKNVGHRPTKFSSSRQLFHFSKFWREECDIRPTNFPLRANFFIFRNFGAKNVDIRPTNFPLRANFFIFRKFGAGFLV